MVANLSKEQVAKLSPEQQEIVARLAIDEGRQRRNLMQRAKHYRGVDFLPWLVVGVACFFWGYLEESGLLLLAVATAAFVLIQFHASGANSRIDAILRLLELEGMKTDGEKPEQCEVSDSDGAIEQFD